MTGLDRCLNVLRSEQPDRIPVVPHMTNFAIWYCGHMRKDVMGDAQKLADCMVKMCEDFELDGLEFAMDTAVSPEALGAKVAYRDDEPAAVVGGAISNYDQVADLPMVDPHRDGRIPICLEVIRILRKRIGDHVLILPSIGQAPFSMAAMVRGMEDFLLDLHEMRDDPSGIIRLIDHCEQCLERIAQAHRDAGAHIVFCGDSLASFDVISPKLYEKLAFPFEKKLADHVHSLDIYFGVHICGNNGPLLPKLVETGADMLDVDYKTDLQVCRDAVGDRAVVRGTVDPSEVFCLGNPELVDRKCRENIEILGQTGRFFMDAGCQIMAHTPHENVHAMVQAARKYSPTISAE
jgi:uroporphyrinogen decarboxylase